MSSTLPPIILQNLSTTTKEPLPPTTENTDTEIVLETITLGMLGFFGFIFGILGLYVTKTNTILSGSLAVRLTNHFTSVRIVRLYISVDLISLTLINGCHLFWGLPNAVWCISYVLLLYESDPKDEKSKVITVTAKSSRSGSQK